MMAKAKTGVEAGRTRDSRRPAAAESLSTPVIPEGLLNNLFVPEDSAPRPIGDPVELTESTNPVQPFKADPWRKLNPREQALADLNEAQKLLDKIDNDPPPRPENMTSGEWEASRNFVYATALAKKEAAQQIIDFGKPVSNEIQPFQSEVGSYRSTVPGRPGRLDRSTVAKALQHQPGLNEPIDHVDLGPLGSFESVRASNMNRMKEYTSETAGPHIAINSARLIDSNTLRILDGEAFKAGRKALDLRSNAVASDNGMHVLTIVKLDYYPLGPEEIREAMELHERTMEDRRLARSVGEPGATINRLGLIVRVSIEPGLCDPSQRIVDTLSVDMSWWMQPGVSAEEMGAHAYAQEHGFTADGHILLMSLDVEGAPPEEAEYIIELDKIIRNAQAAGKDPIGEMEVHGIDPNRRLPLVYGVSNEEETLG